MKKVLCAAAVSILISAVALMSGCEADSASSNDVAISPGSVTLSPGQSQAFTASGGYDYTWSLSDSSLGALSDTVGSTVVYTHTASAGTQIIRVTSTIAGASLGSTNSPGYSMTGEATVYSASSNAPSSTASLAITPGDQTVAVGDEVNFKASGGTAPYTWTVANGSRGSLNVTSGASVTYTASVVGDNTIICEDDAGQKATVKVTAASSATATLFVTPGDQTIATLGPPVTYTAHDGVAPYYWWVGNSAFGTVNNSTGSTTAYTPSGVGTNTVNCRDSIGDRATVTVTAL